MKSLCCRLLEHSTNVIKEAGVDNHTVVGQRGDDVFFAMCPVGRRRGNDHKIEGGAVVVNFDAIHFAGMVLEILQEFAAEAHIAGSFTGPEVSGECAVVRAGDAEEMGGARCAAEALKIVSGDE